jgi:molybdopterin synthase catalytic subunit
MINIVSQKINTEEILESVKDPSAGGIDMFVGTTRDISNGKKVLRLEYEAYEPMAMKMMNEIAEELRVKWKIKKISMVHRIGRVDIGEASVVIAVSATHRREAFEACRYAIDTLKKQVPIWKKEYYIDGEIWVGAQES